MVIFDGKKYSQIKPENSIWFRTKILPPHQFLPVCLRRTNLAGVECETSNVAVFSSLLRRSQLSCRSIGIKLIPSSETSRTQLLRW